MADQGWATGGAVTAAIVALAIAVMAPPRAWVPLVVVGAFALALEPWEQVYSSFGWFSYEPDALVTSGTVPDWYSFQTLRGIDMQQETVALGISVAEGHSVAWTTLVLAAGLLGWAARRRSIPVALVAVAFGALAFYAPGPALLPLAAAALAAFPRGRSYPYFAAGVVLAVPVLQDSVVPLGAQASYGIPSLTPLLTWLVAIGITTGLVVWSLVRKDFLASAIGLAALLASVAIRPEPEPQQLQWLSQEQFTIPGPVLWSALFPAVLPALVLLAGALLHRRRS